MTYSLRDLRHRILPNSLYGRSMMIILTPLLLLQCIVAYIFFDRHWGAMADKLVYALAGETVMIVDSLQSAHSETERKAVIAHASKNLELLVSLEDAKESPIIAHAPQRLSWFSVGKKLESTLASRLTVPFIITDYGQDRWFEIQVQIDNKRVVHIVTNEWRLTSPTVYIFFLWMIGGSLILSGIAVAFMRNQIRPIRKLAVAAEKFGKGQDVAFFKPEGAREVRQAALAFVEMKERIKRQMEQRTAMLAGVSHDLRTPLTRMKLELAMAQEDAGIENIRQDVEEMEKMVEGYLSFARGDGNETPEITDIKAMLERVIANSRRQGYSVQDAVTEGLLLKARPLALERVLGNIISNACKYAKNVWVSACAHTSDIEITVDDDGPGIPAEQRDDVFKPFYRLEKSRNKKTGGVGLGLSIAQDIVHGHGGEIFLEDSNRGGLRVVVRLPK